MGGRLRHRFDLIVILGIFIGLCACGSGGGGISGGGESVSGGNAAPTGSGGTPVAIEIPAMGTVSDIPFASGAVIGGNGSVSASVKAVATHSLLGTKSVPLTSKVALSSGSSFHACKTWNSLGLMTDSMLRSDLNTCILKAVADRAEEAGINLYSGKDVIYSVNTNGDVTAPNKFKVNIIRNDHFAITNAQLWGCIADPSSPRLSAYQHFEMDGKNVAIYGKGYDSVKQLQRSLFTINGTVSDNDPSAYVGSKSATFNFYGDTLISGATTGAGLLTQYPTTAVVNTLFVPGGFQHLAASTDFTNPTSGESFDPRAWQMGAGAATFSKFETTTTGCWEGNTLMSVTCEPSDGHYLAMTQAQGTTPEIQYDIYNFTGNEVWDCQGADTFTVTDYDAAVTSCVERFSLNWSEQDCSALETETAFMVQASGGSGEALSSSAGNPTTLISGAGSFILSANRPLNTASVSDTTVQLEDLTDSITTILYEKTWNNGNDEVMIYYGYSNHLYRLTVAGGDNGIKSADGKALSATKEYYFTVVIPDDPIPASER